MTTTKKDNNSTSITQKQNTPSLQINNNNLTNTLQTPFNESFIDIKDHLNIVTHNVQGLNEPLKLQIWLEYCAKNNYHIISITETKFKNSSISTLSNLLYKIYTSNFEPKDNTQREASMGTAIMLHHKLQPYIFNIQTVAGTAISIDFHLPSNNKLRLISVYLPSNHLEQLKNTQNIVNNWLAQARSHNWHTITMGDFNDNHNRLKRTSNLFTTLQSLSSTSLIEFYAITEPTWQRGSNQSQIDDIWVNSEILLDCSPPKIIDPVDITNSDHKIIVTIWKTNFQLKIPRSKKKKRKIYLYHQMSTDKWEDFTNALELEFKPIPLTQNISTIQQLNKIWNKWSNSIKKVANQIIPKTHTAPKTHYAYSLKATKLHLALKLTNKCLKDIRHLRPPTSINSVIQDINTLLQRISLYTDLTINPCQNRDITSNYQSFLQSLKHLQKTL
jgi:endonuclease/exonuclease/phosphatase family metal-dependent hydrolase